MKRALISVSDKTGVIELAQGLIASEFEIYSTGGTARHLQHAGISVTDVSEYTEFPEMMDGRVKTLHPKIFGGILGRRDLPADVQVMEQHDIRAFDVVCVNLYPFAATISQPNVTLDEAIENIDIGGPSLIRAAAKNHAFVVVLTAPDQYPSVLEAFHDSPEGPSLDHRRRLMVAAFDHTAGYDRRIADYFDSVWGSATAEKVLPEGIHLSLNKLADLRHGENSHQLGAVYSDPAARGTSVVKATQLNGKQLSYNNYLDMDAALAIVRLQGLPACSVIKHNNPCGAAIADDLGTAVAKAFAGDPLSAFGSVVAVNRELDEFGVRFFCDNPNLFVEVIIAPGFTPRALELLTTVPKWRNNVRLMDVGPLTPSAHSLEVRTVAGGAVVQSLDNETDNRSSWTTVTQAKVDSRLLDELAFGWDMVRFVKSNAITLSKDQALVGVGAGQMSRVDSVRIAIEKAGARSVGSVLASDAFFPFPDSIPLAAAAGVAAIIQPGGSVKDAEVIAAADEHGIPMIFTGRRQFKH